MPFYCAEKGARFAGVTLPYAARTLTGAGVGVAAADPVGLVAALGAPPPQPATIAMQIAMAEKRSARTDRMCHLPRRRVGASPGATAELSDHSTIPANLARMPGNTGDRYEVARAALSRIPHGVAIIGAADGPERSCATGTAMYVSFVPAMVVIADHPGSRTCKLIHKSRACMRSVLHDSPQGPAQ